MDMEALLSTETKIEEPICPTCGAGLAKWFGWRGVYFRCGSCGQEFKVSEVVSREDDDTVERSLSRVRCDRV